MKKIFSFILVFILLFLAVGCKPKIPFEDFEDDEDEIIKPNTAITRDGRYVDYVNDLGYATGKDAYKDTLRYGVFGTDLGIPFYSESEKRLYFCYGDTYSGDGFAYPWNNNALLYTDNLNLSKGINYSGIVSGISTFNNYGTKCLQITPDAYDNKNYPDKVTEKYHPLTEVGEDGSIQKTSTCIPTGAIEVNNAYYMFYMEITSFGFGGTGQWCVHSNRVMKSTDNGKTWIQFSNLKWNYDNAPNFGQIFPLEVDDYIYLYGLKGGRQSSLKVARVQKANFEDMKEYEYFVGIKNDIPLFIKGDEGLLTIKTDKNDESSVIYGPCGEMSVIYNEYLNKYVATYQMGTSIVMRISDTPYGPFGIADTVLNNGEFNLNDIYGAFSNGKMTMAKGKKMYFMVSVWFPVYNVHLMELVLK